MDDGRSTMADGQPRRRRRKKAGAHRKPRADVLPGWPKPLPCLGWCGGMHLATHPGDRFCAPCRQTKVGRERSEHGIHDGTASHG